ncbi:MAG: VCBS repeat-containing protein, partial [Flavipsychrobacter sp.]|nr:VCBS repeat-containing protein [Flavipsychrobacter sp.]
MFVLSIATNEVWAQNTLDLAGLSSSSTPKVAYSVRRLSTSYTGKLIQVRRSSDNSLSDIGYNAGNHLDTVALKTFIGGNTGYVVKWYDQSGNGNDGIQATNSSQPMIVSAGTIVRANGEPAIKFNGTNFMDGGSTSYGITNARTLNAAYNYQSGTITAIIDRNLSQNPLFTINANNRGSARNDGLGMVTLGVALTPPFATTFTMTWESGGALSVFANSVNTGTGTNTFPSTMNIMRIGRHFSTTNTGVLNFWEVILFGSAISTSEQEILDCNQQNYFHILPEAIGGTATVCTGNTTTLTHTTAGGTWTSGNTSVATIGSSTGIVTGISAGTAEITYTTSSTCTLNTPLTKIVTVNPNPTISTSSSVAICNGSSTSLTASGGTTYTWSPGTNLSATTGASVTGTPSTTTTYTVTGTTAGCSGTASVTVTVNPAPTITSVGPLIGYPASSVTITGTNFLTTTTDNIVYFGATKASVTSASATSLSATVPTGATFARVTLNSAGCNMHALSPRPYLPSYDNSAFSAASVNVNTKVDFTTGSSPFTISIGDLDGDGKADLAVANYTSNTISVLRNTGSSGSIGSGSFAAKVDYATGGGPYSVRIADIDGDGKRDLIVANTGSNTVSVLRNSSSSGALSFAGKVDFATGASPNAVIVDDFDGDGRQDLATANFGASTTSVLRNTSVPGSVSFATKVDFTAGTTPRILTSGDIDGDGKSDITVANSGGTTLSVFRNTATSGTISAGSFAAKVDFTVGSTPTELSLVDIDGDGKSDMVVVNNSLVSVYRNTSTSGTINSGSFAARLDFTAGTGAFGLGIGDINGDGKPDLVVGNASANTFSILVNTASSGSITSGSFSSKVDFATNSTPFFVAVGDLDGDYKPDIVATNSGSANLSIFRNDPINKNTGTATACVGSTTTLSNAITGGTWSSSDISVATVGSATGVVTGLNAGTATITYNVSGIAATTIVTINPLPTISGLSATTICTGSNTNLTATGAATYNWLPATSLSASTGSSVVANPTVTSTYTVTGIDTNGCSNSSSVTITVITVPTVAEITGNNTVCSGQTTTLSSTTGGGTWSSSNTATGSVSTSGVVTGVAAGAFTITYSVTNSCGTGNTTKAMLGYWTPTIGVSVGSSNSCIGATTTYTATPTTGYTWSSSNGAVATINTGGSVTGIAAGTTVISYTHNTAGCRATAVQTVNTVPTFSVTTPVCATTTQTLTGTPAGGTWTSSNTGVATIGSTSGVFSALTGGTTNIQYTYGPCSATTAVSVSAMPGIITGTTSVCSGSTTQLASGTASQTWSVANTSVATITTLNTTTSVVTGVSTGITTVSYTNASNCSRVVTVTVTSPMTTNTGTTLYCMGQTASLSNTTAGGAWTSSTPGVATANSGTGLINPVSAGTSTITYSTTSPASCQTTTIVTVNAALTANTGTANVCVGQTTTLANSTSGGTWSSSNANATVGSASGIVTGVTAGNSIVTYYKSDACYKNTTVTVNANPVSIAGTLSACEGAAATTLTCSTANGTWSSSNTSVATVGSSTGTVTPVSSGTTTITYKLTSTGCYSTATFTVNPTPVSFTTASAVCTGITTTLSTTPAGGTWISGTTGVASIGSSSGILTGASAGTTIITYTLATGCSRNETITVNPSPTATTGTMNACVGSTSTLANTTSGGTWLSSSTAVATVGSSTGVVTGVTAGTATISYQLTATGCYSASTFTVNATPSAIGGTFSICTGSSTTLTNTITGGTWTSAAPAVATVGSANGTVTGVSAGTAEISYTLTAGCYKTSIVTINAVPVISGSLELCDGSVVTLNATPTGGTWSSGNTAV